MKRRTDLQGFTLIEVLVVITILVILVSISFSALRGAVQRQQMAEAASQVVQNIEKLRSSAAKTSRSATLTFNISRPKEYVMSYSDGGTAPIQQTVTLPNGASMSVENTDASGSASVSYLPPYGEVSATNRTITITPANGDTTRVRRIYIVGVTGQVHQ